MNDRYRTDLFVQHLYKDQPGKLRFDPEKIRTKEEFDAWKEQVREKAYELMQFPEDAYEKPEVRFLFSRQRDGYRVEKYEISPSSGYRFFCWCLTPFPRKTKPPAFSVSPAGMCRKKCSAGRNP